MVTAAGDCQTAITALGSAWANLLAAYQTARNEQTNHSNRDYLETVLGESRFRSVVQRKMIHAGLGFIIEKGERADGRPAPRAAATAHSDG